jgi:rhodanese-related sulfurtransferase
MAPDGWILMALTDSGGERNMSSRIELPALKRLIDQTAQLVEVLPAAEYAEAHLPGAINIPLKQLDRSTSAPLDRHRPIVVYCYDYL